MSKLPTPVSTLAMDLAKAAFARDEIPVGAVIFDSKTHEIISSAHNMTEELSDVTAHAERLAISQACQKLGRTNLAGYSLYTTLEPCPMCAGAIGWAKLDALYFGASDPKSGGVDVGTKTFTHPQSHHKPAIHRGFNADFAGDQMTAFFKRKRNKK